MRVAAIFGGTRAQRTRFGPAGWASCSPVDAVPARPVRYWFVQREAAIVTGAVATGRDRTLIPQLAQVRRLEWAPDGASLLVSGVGNDGADGLFRIDLQSGGAVFLAARVPGTRILSGTDGAAMIYENDEGDAILGEFSTNTERVLFRSRPGNNRVYEAVFSHDRRKLAVRAVQFLIVVDLATGDVRDLDRKNPAPPGESLWAMAWSADDRQIVALANPVALNGRAGF